MLAITLYLETQLLKVWAIAALIVDAGVVDYYKVRKLHTSKHFENSKET